MTQNESDLKEKLAIISELLNNYIVDMESYITPKDSGTMVRVDRNDIWWNYKQIAQRIPYAPEFEEIQSDVFSSLADYKKCFVYNPFEDEGANSARKAAQQAEEEAERKRREYNYEQLESFREVLRGKLKGSLKQSVEKIHRMYEDAIVPFENTDDEYKKKLGSYYNEWASVGDKFADGWHVVKNAGLGVWDGLTDLVLGILNLLKGVGEVVLWLALQNPVTSYFGIRPEFLEEDMGELWIGIKQLLKDPGNIVEAIGQSTFDTVDEKGVAYSVSYVTTDVVAGLLLDKGLGKLGALGKADDVAGAAGDVAKYTDEVAEAASKAGKYTDDVSKAVKKTAGKAVSESGLKTDGIKNWNEISNMLRKEGVDEKKISEILSTSKGGRPDPTTYLSKEYIDAHLSHFQNGVTKIKSKAPIDTEGIGLGTFVMPKSVADDVITQAGGNVFKLEELLGLNSGDLGTNPVRVDIPNPQNIRIPSGNEVGAWPGYWTPGGYTKPGGVMEAVIDPVPKTEYVVTENILGK